MADPILHIKDSYYFELPHGLWWPYQSLEQVPSWLRAAHPEATLDQFNHDLEGKFIIPQLFGTPKNLYECASGFCVSKFMIVEILVAALLCLVFIWVARRLRQASAGPPQGRLWNLFEAMLVFVRDGIARQAIGGGHASHAEAHGQEQPAGPGHDAPHGHQPHAGGVAVVHASPYADADRFVPLLWTLFFFILFCNLMGILPWLGAPTGEWGVTLALACVTFGTVLIAGTLRFGVIGFWRNQVPTMDLPIWLWPLKLFIFVIEVFGLVIRHGVLSVRLPANMAAGHLVLLAILGLIATASQAMFATVATASVLGTAALTFLELFVAFLQAYVFTLLSAVFIGAAIHSH